MNIPTDRKQALKACQRSKTNADEAQWDPTAVIYYLNGYQSNLVDDITFLSVYKLNLCFVFGMFSG